MQQHTRNAVVVALNFDMVIEAYATELPLRHLEARGGQGLERGSVEFRNSSQRLFATRFIGRWLIRSSGLRMAASKRCPPMPNICMRALNAFVSFIVTEPAAAE